MMDFMTENNGPILYSLLKHVPVYNKSVYFSNLLPRKCLADIIVRAVISEFLFFFFLFYNSFLFFFFSFSFLMRSE